MLPLARHHTINYRFTHSNECTCNEREDSEIYKVENNFYIACIKKNLYGKCIKHITDKEK